MLGLLVGQNIWKDYDQNGLIVSGKEVSRYCFV